jgi:hypothetical protein
MIMQIKNIVYKYRLVIPLVVAVLNFTSCKKFIEVKSPITSTNSENVYASDATAAAVLTGMYINISSNSLASGGLTSITLFSGLSADEFTLYSGVLNGKYIAYYKNSLSSTLYGNDSWNNLYTFIFTCNSAIEKINNSSSLTPSVKQQLLGEAFFMRGFLYFYLVNLYGDVPLVTGTDYKINSTLKRTPQDQIYEQIISDLKLSQAYLSDNYLSSDIITSSNERVRPNKFAASALLARAYLYNGEYSNAEFEASSIINNATMYSLNALTGAFQKASLNNNEAIWQLQPVNAGWNTEDARIFIIPSTGLSDAYPVYLSDNLLNSFEVNDLRRRSWVDSVIIGTTKYYYLSKYKNAIKNSPVTEYLMVLRLAEQYLIRAEARAQLNNISAAQSDLNAIRNRAGLPNTTANTMSDLMVAILHERQDELFGELGHRWLDLKRTANVDVVMGPVCAKKGGVWNTNWKWYPIPQYELDKDTRLVQNTGY